MQGLLSSTYLGVPVSRRQVQGCFEVIISLIWAHVSQLQEHLQVAPQHSVICIADYR